MARSLKRRLTANVIAIVIVSWLISALATTLAARVVFLREMDRLLESIVLVVESVGEPFLEGELAVLQDRFSEKMEPVSGPPRDHGTREHPSVLRLREDLLQSPLGVPSVNVWVGSIQLLVGESTPAFTHPSSVIAGEVWDTASDQVVDGAPWRVIYRHNRENDVWYAVGMAKRQAQFDGSQLVLQILLPLSLIIPLTVIALYYGIARGLQPLRLLARQIERRQQQHSLEPVAQTGVPEEVEPVVNSLNHLLARLADTLENEQRFTANAAHELQTPLAAITTEVQVCQRLLKEGEGREMMERIHARVQRASHSVKQLLVLARLDPRESLSATNLNLHEISSDVISELGHLASERNLQLRFEVDADQEIRGDREALLILLRNLINNAFRYTPTAGTVRIASSTGTLTIENEADPVDDPARLVERFHRGDSDPADHGTGLGLSIVKRICELHGFDLELAYRAGNFVVTVYFPYKTPA